ncbi:MAG: hypothetical protein ACW97A_08440, partial [Candidatus Thorarchaeota archaeon]
KYPKVFIAVLEAVFYLHFYIFNIMRCEYTINDPPLETKGCIGEAILGYHRGNILYYLYHKS